MRIRNQQIRNWREIYTEELRDFNKEILGLMKAGRARQTMQSFFEHYIKEEKEKIKQIREKHKSLKKDIENLQTLNDEMHKIIENSAYGFSVASISEALEKYNVSSPQNIICLTVGGEDFIFLSTNQPELAIEKIVMQARDFCTQPIHKQLRRFGFLHSFKVLKVCDSEILALVELFIEHSKRKPKLGCMRPFHTQNFELIEELPDASENVLGVSVISLMKQHSEINKNSKSIEVIYCMIDILKDAQLDIKERIKKLNIWGNNTDPFTLFDSSLEPHRGF